jgi:hypothetical protein
MDTIPISRSPSLGSYAFKDLAWDSKSAKISSGVLDPLDFPDQIRVEFAELSSFVSIPKSLAKDKKIPETKKVPYIIFFVEVSSRIVLPHTSAVLLHRSLEFTAL